MSESKEAVEKISKKISRKKQTKSYEERYPFRNILEKHITLGDWYFYQNTPYILFDTHYVDLNRINEKITDVFLTKSNFNELCKIDDKKNVEKHNLLTVIVEEMSRILRAGVRIEANSYDAHCDSIKSLVLTIWQDCKDKNILPEQDEDYLKN